MEALGDKLIAIIYDIPIGTFNEDCGRFILVFCPKLLRNVSFAAFSIAICSNASFRVACDEERPNEKHTCLTEASMQKHLT